MTHPDDLEALRFTDSELAEPITPGGCMVLLTMAAAVNHWVIPSVLAAHMWHEVLGATSRGCAMRAGDALAALHEHLTISTEQPQPAHLVAIVDGWREQHTQSGAAAAMPVGGRAPRLVSGPAAAAAAGLPVARPAGRALPPGRRYSDHDGPWLEKLHPAGGR